MPVEHHKFYPFNVHDDLKHLKEDELYDYQSTCDIGLHVAVFNTIKDFNLAGVVRSACSFGFNNFHIIGNRKWDKRGAVGAYNYLDFHYHSDFESFVSSFNSSYRILGVEVPGHYEQDLNFTSIQDFVFHKNDVILIGQESVGIEPEQLQQCFECIYVPTTGTMRSLNAASCASIIMSQAYLQSKINSLC